MNEKNVDKINDVIDHRRFANDINLRMSRAHANQAYNLSKLSKTKQKESTTNAIKSAMYATSTGVLAKDVIKFNKEINRLNNQKALLIKSIQHNRDIKNYETVKKLEDQLSSINETIKQLKIKKSIITSYGTLTGIGSGVTAVKAYKLSKDSKKYDKDADYYHRLYNITCDVSLKKSKNFAEYDKDQIKKIYNK